MATASSSTGSVLLRPRRFPRIAAVRDGAAGPAAARSAPSDHTVAHFFLATGGVFLALDSIIQEPSPMAGRSEVQLRVRSRIDARCRAGAIVCVGGAAPLPGGPTAACASNPSRLQKKGRSVIVLLEEVRRDRHSDPMEAQDDRSMARGVNDGHAPRPRPSGRGRCSQRSSAALSNRARRLRRDRLSVASRPSPHTPLWIRSSRWSASLHPRIRDHFPHCDLVLESHVRVPQLFAATRY